jgi:hypothetical protein
MRVKYFAGSLLPLVLSIVASVLGAEQPKAVTDPAKAGRDGQIQGEYLLSGTTAQGDEKYGVQIVALGGGEFMATRFVGGLPGAGAEPYKRTRTIPGHTVDGETTFVERQTVVKFAKDGSVTVKNALFDALVAKLEKQNRTSSTLGAKPPLQNSPRPPTGEGLGVRVGGSATAASSFRAATKCRSSILLAW